MILTDFALKYVSPMMCLGLVSSLAKQIFLTFIFDLFFFIHTGPIADLTHTLRSKATIGVTTLRGLNK